MNKKMFLIIATMLVIAGLIMSGCVSSAQATRMVQTARAESAATVVAEITATAQAVAGLPPAPTPTLIPTSSPTPTRQAAVPEQPTATATPPSAVAAPSEVCYLLGGRWFDFEGKGHEYVAVALRSWLERGAPMQMNWNQVSSAAKLPDGLTPPEKFEIMNDGVQAVVCADVTYAMPRDPGAKVNSPVAADGIVTFNEVSWIRLQSVSIQICEDDTGGVGQWAGLCAGSTETITYSTTVEILIGLRDFAHYAGPLQNCMDSDIVLSDEQPLQVCEVFEKGADPLPTPTATATP